MAGTAAASVPAQYPPSGGSPRLTQHTHRRGGPQRLTLPSPRLVTGPAIICHTGPARTFDQDRQTLGQLYEGRKIMPWRLPPFWALSRSEPPIAALKDRSPV